MDGLASLLQRRLQAWRDDGLFRHRNPRTGTPLSPRVSGESCTSFSTNDYLGLAHEERLIDAFIRGARDYGVGAGASELASGHTQAHAALEAELAEFTGRPRALVFSTGYMANLGVLAALARRGDTLYVDRLNHASLIDAAILSRARTQRYAHGDPEALRACLARAHGGQRLVVTDGVFSMDGDIAPLPALAALCRAHGATLVVDDAHAIGVLGQCGRGSAEHHGLGIEEVPVLVGTFGKALGVFGAFVAGGDVLIDALIQFARPYIYTTALPPAVAVAVSEALRIVRSEPERRERLHRRIGYFRERALGRGVPITASITPIQPILIGDVERMMAIDAQLRRRRILVGAIRPPTVPAQTARLRVALSAAHTEYQIDALVDALALAL